MLYFAYGSNLDPDQMRARCPDNRAVGIARLREYRLCFPRRSAHRDCGVASIEPFAGAEVWGAIYDLTEADVARLDHWEGYVLGRAVNRYDRRAIAVEIDGALGRVETYIAQVEASPPPPNLEYLGHLRRGARAHGLPPHYVAMLDALSCGDDLGASQALDLKST
jgi:hypothetical protein